MCYLGIMPLPIKSFTNEDYWKFYQEQSNQIESDCHIVKKIFKQYKVDSVSYAGNYWYDRQGNLITDVEISEMMRVTGIYKFEVSYTTLIGNKETWCFN